jgi:hypothetical protein
MLSKCNQFVHKIFNTHVNYKILKRFGVAQVGWVSLKLIKM